MRVPRANPLIAVAVIVLCGWICLGTISLALYIRTLP